MRSTQSRWRVAMRSMIFRARFSTLSRGSALGVSGLLRRSISLAMCGLRSTSSLLAMGRSTTLTRVARIRSLTKERTQQSGRWSKIQVMGAKKVTMKGGNESFRWLNTSSYCGSPRVSRDDSVRNFISFSFVASYSVGNGDRLSDDTGVT